MRSGSIGEGLCAFLRPTGCPRRPRSTPFAIVELSRPPPPSQPRSRYRPRRGDAVRVNDTSTYDRHGVVAGCRASSATIEDRRAPAAARVGARHSARDPPSTRDGGDFSSIAFVSMFSWLVLHLARSGAPAV
ncbi:hypothetical protein THAOC_23974 [Thalassiosira oceanica]|uniref:Uncharacterized protein n=1 Tax=Thalassiosira oceanica TaxID=159749 RepID=K0RTA7_THAOC|nr:hypothetical protein THAOC_23974 [Thalassiosira oceanica]|eukprot:EJK56190.1 hypothetical protein THAOC_23974 [Thalassiosira oceanica]